MKRLSLFLASIAPGLFLIGYNIGTGSITTMAASGAAYGLSLIWPLLLSCLFTFFLIMVFGRYTAITGKTAIGSFRQYFGKGWALVVMWSILISEWMAIMGIMGVVAQVIQEWSRPLTTSGEGISPLLIAIVFASLLYALFWRGEHRLFERVLAVFVGIMGLSFLATTFLVTPDPQQLLAGLVPDFPSDQEKLLLMAGMVGTTMGTVIFVMRSILVQEKGWKVSDLRFERRDAIVSASMMFVLSASVMIAAAGTMYSQGLKVENAIDMVKLMEPLAGRFAVSVFVGGLICAGLSSLFPNLLLAPWLMADYEGSERNLTSTRSRLLVGFGALLSLGVPLFGGRPVLVMIVSQAGVAVASPIALILMMILVNRRDLMGEHVFSWWKNALFSLIIAFTLLMAAAGLMGLWNQFG